MPTYTLKRPYVEPDYVRKAPGEARLCEGCGVRLGREVHHREHKGMGGRRDSWKGAARSSSESAANKILLCHVCHFASHLEHHIDPDGFHCGICPRLESCFYGLRTLGHDADGRDPPW